jgi:uncharacterized membrane protein
LAFLKTPTCVLAMPMWHNYAERHPARTLHTWRACLRTQQAGKHFSSLNKFSFLPVIGSSEC